MNDFSDDERFDSLFEIIVVMEDNHVDGFERWNYAFDYLIIRVFLRDPDDGYLLKADKGLIGKSELHVDTNYWGLLFAAFKCSDFNLILLMEN
jgi:hypothetical protein